MCWVVGAHRIKTAKYDQPSVDLLPDPLIHPGWSWVKGKLWSLGSGFSRDTALLKPHPLHRAPLDSSHPLSPVCEEASIFEVSLHCDNFPPRLRVFWHPCWSIMGFRPMEWNRVYVLQFLDHFHLWISFSGVKLCSRGIKKIKDNEIVCRKHCGNCVFFYFSSLSLRLLCSAW